MAGNKYGELGGGQLHKTGGTRELPRPRGTQFTCFTRTKVQILTPEELLETPDWQKREDLHSDRRGVY